MTYDEKQAVLTGMIIAIGCIALGIILGLSVAP